MFSKTYSEIESMWSIIQTRKESFCQVIVNNYSYNVLCQLLIKIKITWKRKYKEPRTGTPADVTGTVRSSHRRYSIKKLFWKILQYPQETYISVGVSFYKKLQTFRFATLLKKTPTQVFSCEYCETFKVATKL